MTPLSSFIPLIAYRVPGCPEPLIQRAVVDAAILFAEDSMVLRERLDAVSVGAGATSVQLDTPSQTRITRIFALWAGEDPVAPIPALTPVLITASGESIAYTTTRTGDDFLLRFAPTPQTAFSLTAEVAVCPTRSATSLSNELYDQWREAVVAGTLARLHSVPSQPFTDVAASIFYEKMFATLTRKARVEGNFGRTQGGLRAMPRSFV